MSLASRLKALVLAAGISATPALAWQAPVTASDVATRPHAIDVRQQAGLDPFARDEEEFDRKFGMCRRC